MSMGVTLELNLHISIIEVIDGGHELLIAAHASLVLVVDCFLNAKYCVAPVVTSANHTRQVLYGRVPSQYYVSEKSVCLR